MSYDMNAQGNKQMLPSMSYLMNQSGVPFCNKHDSVLNSYCMTHQLPLCQACIPEHFQLLAQSSHNMQNTPQDQMGRSGPQSQNCDLLPMDRAIQESLSFMKSSLSSVQDFIEFKKGFVDFPDESTLQMFLTRNQSFEQAYNQAHRHLTNLQGMPSGQKELNLSSLNTQFFEEYKRLVNARQNIEALCQQIQSGHRTRPSPMKAPGQQQMHGQANLYSNGDHGQYLDHAQQMLQHPQQQMHHQQDIYANMFKQQHQQQPSYSQMHMAQQSNSSYDQGQNQKQSQGQLNQSQYHQQMQQSVVPQQKPTAATSHYQTPQSQAYGHQQQDDSHSSRLAMNTAQSQSLHGMGQSGQPGSMNQQHNVGNQLPAPNTQSSNQMAQQQMSMHQENAGMQHQGDDFFSDSARGRVPQQSHHGTTLPSIRSTNAGIGQTADQFQKQQALQNQQVANQQQVNYNRKKHWGLTLNICVDVEELRERPGGYEQDNSQGKTYWFEVEIEASWSLKQLRQRIKEDIMRAQVLSDPNYIDVMYVFLAEGLHRSSYNQNFPPLSSATGFTPIHSQHGQTLEDLNVKNGNTIFFTFNQKYNSSPRGINRQRDRSEEERATAQHQMHPQQITNQGQLGSPQMTHQTHMQNPNAQQHAYGQQQYRPTHSSIQHVQNRLPQKDTQQLQNRQTPMVPKYTKPVIKRSASLNGKKDVELDEHGNPIKKQRAKKVPKEVKMIDIQYRLYQKPAQEPPVEQSENPEGEDQEQPAAAAPKKTEEPFLRSIQVNEKARLKVIKKAILEQLGADGMCLLRVFAYENRFTKEPKPVAEEKTKEDEPKEGEDKKEEEAPEEDFQVTYEQGSLYEKDMMNLKDLGLENGGKVEVEVYFTLEVSVTGKGSNYQTRIEVSPNDKMDVIRSKVPFFKIFVQRRYQIFAPEGERVFDENELGTLMFRDVGMHNGSKIILKEPERQRPAASQAENEASADVEANDAEARESEVDQMMDEGWGEGAEGGEDEMIEMIEGGEDEIVEMGFAGQQEGDDVLSEKPVDDEQQAEPQQEEVVQDTVVQEDAPQVVETVEPAKIEEDKAEENKEE